MKTKKTAHNSGFTLIEVMISMVIAGILASGMYSVYAIQSRSYTVQDQISEMQQILRSAMSVMTREIRMAAFNPTGNCNAKILIDNDTLFTFETCDNDHNDYSVAYQITYNLYGAYTDSVTQNDLGRIRQIPNGSTASNSPLAEDIDGLEFQYLDTDGAVTAVNSEIRTVEVSMLIRAGSMDRKYTNTTTYLPASGNASWLRVGVNNPPGDNYHRRLLITRIQLRNMGLL